MPKSRDTFSYFPNASVVRCHCHSHFGGPWPDMPPRELEAMVTDLHAAAAFSEIKLVAFSLQPTQFDFIADVPRNVTLTKKEMLRRFEAFSAPNVVERELPDLKQGDADAWSRLKSRFGSLSSLIKRFKQKSTRHYHRAHGTSGSLWSNRYDQVFVEPGHPSRVLTAWIDHAAVRAGRADSPADDKTSTFGRAVSGDQVARSMIQRLFLPDDPHASWQKVAAAYRSFINVDELPPNAVTHHRGKPPLTRKAFLHYEVPHLHGGIALGSQQFIEDLYALNRTFFSPGRPSGPRFITGQADPDLWTLRDRGDLRRLKKR
jgi:hypothetical protein